MPPVDRFRQWWKDNHATIKALCQVNGWDIKEVWAEGPKMATWVMTAGKKGDKKNWGRFIANWMRTYYQNKTQIPMMTAEQENAHYAGHRRSGGDKETTLGAVIDSILGPEKAREP